MSKCLHCVLGPSMMKFLDQNPDYKIDNVAFRLGELVRDVLASNGYDNAMDVPPEKMGPVLEQFMRGIGLEVGEAEITGEGRTH